jgi:uncharacterized repeat protein (TIGR01451 family)
MDHINKNMMNTPARTYLSLRHLRQWVLPVVLLMAALFAQEAHAAISATRTSSPVFYTNSNAGTASTSPKCNYLSFDITSSTAIDDGWITIDGFSSNLSLGGGDDGLFHFGPFTAGETKSLFFYVCSSYTGGGDALGETYTLTPYEGKPGAGGVAQTDIDFTTDIDDSVIQANSNQVNAIWADINPSVLGATTTLTVDGDTGTIGCANPPSACSGSSKGPLTFSPATFTDWRADAYELVGTSIVLSVGNTGTYDNVLYLDNVASKNNTHYVVTYFFRPVSTTASTTTLSPVSYIASGTQIKHTSLSSGAYSGGLLPILPAVNEILLAKSVSHATLPAQGGVVTYTLSATNSGSFAVSLDSFIDVLPAGATYVANSTTFNDETFADPYISGSTLDWSSLFDIPAGATRSLIFQATLPATPATYTNSATALIGAAVIDTTLSTSDNVPPTADTVVLNAPTISKAFSPTALAIGNSSTLTLTIGNTNTAHTLSGIAISDTLPAAPTGLVFATPPNAATTCTGASLNISGTTISISGGSLAAEQSCTVSVEVTSSANNTYTNITDVVSSSNGGTGSTASADIIFSPKPTIDKSFSVATIPINGTATMSFVITNNTAAAITGMSFSDTYPANLVNETPPNVSTDCGGTVTATAGVGSLSLAGGGIAVAGDTCSISVDVTSATAGDYANVTTGVDSNESTPAGPVSNTATLSVLAPPTVSKVFSPSTIGKDQTSTLTITLTNPNAAAITGAAFTDTYPTDLVTAGTPNEVTTCASGSVGTTAGTVSLSTATIPASGSCTVSVDVTSSVVNLGGYTNTIAIGAVTTSNTGSNTGAASDTLIVNATPTITKSFSFNPATGIGTMDIDITNNDVAPITNLSFTDLFPAGMSTDDPPSLSADPPCGVGSSLQSWDGTTAGTLSASGGDLGVKLTAGQIAASGSCSFSINLTVNALGVYQNQTSGLTSDDFAGTGSVSNTATWIAPSVGKLFTPDILGPSDTTRLVITITNPSLTTTLTGLAIADIYPTTATDLSDGDPISAAITSPTPNESNTCGGTLTAISTGMTLSGGTLAPGASCTIAADVLATDTTPAIYSNVTGNVASNEGIGTSASDSLIVTDKPTIVKSFLTSPVTLSGGTATSVMRLVVENNSGLDITAVSFSDIFPTSPSQMVWVSTDANSCGGTLTDDADAALSTGVSTSIKLVGGAITALGVTCTIDITVSVSAAGSYDNTTTGATSSANAVIGPVSNTAQLVATLAAPTATKAFDNAGFQVDSANKLTITLTNPNTTAITNAAFTDTYPANLVNAPTPNLVNNCSGTATAAAGGSSLSLSGGTIPASSSCTIEVDLTATTAGAYTNTLLADAVTSTNAGSGPVADVTANTTAYLPPVLVKAFGAATLGSGDSTTLVLTLSNPGSNVATITNLQVDDTFPAGMMLQNITFTFTPAACGTVTKISGAASVAGDDNIRFDVASLAVGVSCEVSVNITSSTVGAVTNTTDAPVATSPVALTGTTAWASITVQALPSLTLLKTVQTISDPVNLASNPKAIPGAYLDYTVMATNSGAGTVDNDAMIINDPIPAGTELFVNDLGGAGSGPVAFTDGGTASGLSYTFTALGNGADDLEFSDDSGATWTYTPTADADGFDAAVTNIRVNPKGVFAAAGAGNPSFSLTFRVRLQ